MKEEEKIPIYKIELYLIDVNEYNYSLEDIKETIEESQDGVAISNMCLWGDCKKKHLKLKDFDNSKWNKTSKEKECLREARKLFK